MTITFTVGVWMLPLAVLWLCAIGILILDWSKEGLLVTGFGAIVITAIALLTRFLP